MKYLFINSVYGFGSTGRIIADKCEQLKNEGHECAAAYGRTCADNGAAQLIRIGTKPDYLFHAGITRLAPYPMEDTIMKRSTLCLILYLSG